MAFPTKMYFSLSEVSARWHRQTKDVEYCIENGLLNAHIKVCSVKLTSNMLLTKFPHNSQEIYEYTGCKRITPEDCHILFRHYKRQVSEFISSDDTKREKLVFPEKITIKKVDLMILLCDLKQFEEKYQLKYEEQDLPLWNNNVSSSEIAVNNDCDFFYIGNTLYSFGHMRRDIRLNKCKYTLPIYKAAFYYTINDLLKITIGEREYMELEYSYRNDGCQLRSIQYRKAVELGLFDNFDETLEKMAKERGHG